MRGFFWASGIVDFPALIHLLVRLLRALLVADEHVRVQRLHEPTVRHLDLLRRGADLDAENLGRLGTPLGPSEQAFEDVRETILDELTFVEAEPLLMDWVIERLLFHGVQFEYALYDEIYKEALPQAASASEQTEMLNSEGE